jgi:hypothetical protein
MKKKKIRADYFLARYGNKLPVVFFPFALLILILFSMMFIDIPGFCPWGRNVTTIIDLGVLAGALLIGMLLFYEALNNLMVVLNAIIFFISKVLNEEDPDFDGKTVTGLLILFLAALLYIALGIIAAKLIGDNAGRGIACMEGY